MPNSPRPSNPARPLLQTLLVIAPCVALFWVGLGHAGFSGTEGHRVEPAWEMLDNGDWWLTRLFDRPYLRKPPGMAWAIAASSAVLGRTEFAARAVSAGAATVSALVALWAARRWFGPRAGLAAGLAQALMPVWFTYARSAEIESLHVLTCQGAMVLTIDLLLRAGGPTLARGAALGATLGAAALVKGPAGLPVFVAVFPACAIAARSWRVTARPAVLAAVALAGGVLGAAYLALRHRLESSGEAPVLQDPSQFMPAMARVSAILRVFPAALVQGLPMTGVLPFALWPPADAGDRERGTALGAPPDAPVIARSLALTFVLAVVLFMLAGVSNPRYALPAIAALAPLAGYVWVGRLGMFGGWRRRIAAWSSLGRLWVWPALGVVLGGAYIACFFEARRARIGGNEAGAALGAALPDDCDAYADGLIDARPDVLMYARARAVGLGKRLRVHWVDLEAFAPPPGGTVVVIVRNDPEWNEAADPRVSAVVNGWRRVHSGRVYHFGFDTWAREPGPR